MPVTFPKQHDFLVVFDSDGAVFDTAEIKVNECFIPQIILRWDLQAAARFVREAALFVSLRSQTRGSNRFPALVRTFDLLREWPAVRARGVEIPDVEPLRQWALRETRLSNAALAAEAERTGNAVLARALAWSRAVNDSIAEMVRGVPPFPSAREGLRAVSEFADILVSSTTPAEALEREWNEHGIRRYPAFIAGQEMGSKIEHIRQAAAGRYEGERILMIGDSPGDLAAARANGAHFYPVVPGREEESWQEFARSAAADFRRGEYSREREAARVDAFNRELPAGPPWLRTTDRLSTP